MTSPDFDNKVQTLVQQMVQANPDRSHDLLPGLRAQIAASNLAPKRIIIPQALRGTPAFFAVILLAVLSVALFAGLRHVPAGSSPMSSNTVLYDISMLTADEGWALGGPWDTSSYDHPQSFVFYHYLYGTWTPQPIVSIDPTIAAIYIDDFKFVSPTDGWAVGNAIMVGSGEKTLMLHYNGVHWAPLPAPQQPPQSVQAALGFIGVVKLQILSDASIWLAASNLSLADSQQQLPVIAHFVDGKTWHIETVPLPKSYQQRNTNLDIAAVAMVNDQEGWIAATLGAPSTSTDPSQGPNGLTEAVIYHRVHNQWQLDSTLATISLDQFGFLAPGEGWGLGTDQTHPAEAFLHFSAHTLTRQAISVSGALHMLSPTNGWLFASENTGIAIYHYDGAQWRKVQTITIAHRAYAEIFESSFSSPDDGWAVGNSSAKTAKNTDAYYPLLLHYTQGSWVVAQL